MSRQSSTDQVFSSNSSDQFFSSDPLQILLIEDDRSHQDIFSANLSDWERPNKCHCLPTGEEAVSQIRDQKASFDVIVADNGLGGRLSGMEVLAALRRAGVETPFILMSARGSEQLASQAFREGASDYFSKQEILDSFPRLLHSIESVLALAQARAEAKEREHQFQELFNKSNDAILIVDPRSNKIIDANETATRLFGYTRRALLKFRYQDCFAEPQKKETGHSSDPFSRASLNTHTYSNRRRSSKEKVIPFHHPEDLPHTGISEGSFKHRKGQLVPVEMSTSLVTFGKEKVFQAVIRDITARKEAELRTQRRTLELLALNRIIAVVNEEVYLDQLLEKVLQQVLDTTDASGGGLFIVHGDALELKAAKGLTPKIQEQIKTLPMESFPLTKMGRCSVENEATCTLRKALKETEHHSIACQALNVKDRFLGFLLLVSDQGKDFAGEYPLLLPAMGHQIGIAIDNSRLFEETSRSLRQKSALLELGKVAMTTLERYSLLDRLLGLVVQGTGSQIAAYYEESEDHSGLDLRSWHPMEESSTFPEFILSGEDPLSTSFHSNQVYSAALSKEWLPWKERPVKMVSEAVIPLPVGEKVQGVIYLGSPRKHAFSEEDRDLISLFCAHVGMSLENLQLYDMVKKSQEKYRSLIQNLNEIIFTVEMDGTITFVNEQVIPLLGYDTREVIGHKFQDFIHPDDVKICKRAVKTLVRYEQQALSLEYRARHKDGTYRWHMVNATTIKNDEGKVVSLLGASTDDTEKKELINELRAKNEELQVLSRTDSLTKLSNYRYFRERLEEEITRCQRYHRDLSLLMLDLDHFKEFNDTYGHLLGDSILFHLGAVLLTKLRKNDLAARYGGEEFCVILPDTPLEGGYEIADRIRKAVPFMEPSGTKELPKISISIGVTCLRVFDRPISIEELVKEADMALYEAKRTGRDKVCIYSGANP